MNSKNIFETLMSAMICSYFRYFYWRKMFYNANCTNAISKRQKKFIKRHSRRRMWETERYFFRLSVQKIDKNKSEEDVECVNNFFIDEAKMNAKKRFRR